MKLKKILLTTVVLCSFSLYFAISVNAETEVASGTCEENLSRSPDEAGTLTIKGEGAMYNYIFSSIPQKEHRNLIKNHSIKQCNEHKRPKKLCFRYTFQRRTSID